MATSITDIEAQFLTPDGQLDPEALGPEGLRLQLVISSDKFRQLVSYPVIVEQWLKKNGGRVRRSWLAEFSEEERNLIGKYQAKFYRWYLVTGPPAQVSMTVATLGVLQRAANFFGTV